jgi:hypothetical protein
MGCDSFGQDRIGDLFGYGFYCIYCALLPNHVLRNNSFRSLSDNLLVVRWLNNARNSLLDLAERSRVGHPLKTGDQPCVVESPKNSS